jgi:hypothetical protein
MDNSPDHETICICCCCCPCSHLIDSCFQSMFPLVIEFVHTHPETKYEVFKEMADENYLQTNLMRLGGFLLLFVGIGLLFSPIISLVSMIPLIGNLLAVGISIAIWVGAFIVGVTLSALTIGLAWLYYRPIFGIFMLFLTAGGIMLLIYGG